jgi:hypothetical protein
VEELEREILADFVEPIGAVGVMVAAEGSKTGILKLTHGHALYSSRPSRDHVNRGTSFCYEGDVDGTDAYIFAFDRNQLGLTPYVDVPWTADRHYTLLQGDPADNRVSPFTEDADNVHTIRTRTLMFIPFVLVENLLGKDYTAHEAYLTVYPLLEALDLLKICLPLVEFLQVASTQPTNGNPRPFTLQDRLGQADYPVRPAVVTQRRTAVLFRQLPVMMPTNQGHLPDSFAETLADCLTNIATEMHADRRARESRVVESTRSKTFWERYGDRIADGMLRFTAVVDDDLLPPFYQELGGKQKGESDRVLLQREVDQSAEAFDVLAFTVSPSQVIALRTLDFAGISLGEVGTVLLPLNIIPPEATSLSADRALTNNHAQAKTFDLSGDPSSGVLSTADTHRLRNQKGYLPVDWMEARTQIRCTLALLGALCGNEHPVPAAWRGMLQQYEHAEARIRNEIDTEVGTRLGPALFVFHLQLILRDWFEDQTRTGQTYIIPAPDFGLHLKTFERQNNLNWLPSVSYVPALLALRPAAPCRQHAPRPSVTSAALAAPPATASRGAPSAVQRPDLGSLVRSPSRDARFTGSTAFANNVRTRRVQDAIQLAGRSALPELVRGGASVGMCVSYHAKYSCFEGCQRAASHSPLTAAEKAPFHEWCVLAYA